MTTRKSRVTTLSQPWPSSLPASPVRILTRSCSQSHARNPLEASTSAEQPQSSVQPHLSPAAATAQAPVPLEVESTSGKPLQALTVQDDVLRCNTSKTALLPPLATDERCGNEEHTCPTCQEIILEATEDVAGHDAIFCDGEGCQTWYHRWCAGVNKKRHEVLSASEAPFFCPSCVMEQQSRDIATLQEAVKALTAQLSELQLQQIPTNDEQPSTRPQQQWSTVVRKGKGGSKGKGKGNGKVTADGQQRKADDHNQDRTGAASGRGRRRPTSQAETIHLVHTYLIPSHTVSLAYF